MHSGADCPAAGNSQRHQRDDDRREYRKHYPAQYLSFFFAGGVSYLVWYHILRPFPAQTFMYFARNSADMGIHSRTLRR